MKDPQELLADLDPDQRQVAANPLGPMCVRAGAGTGKTRAITYRLAYGVASGAYPPGQVLAVTFTAKAAGEMRERLRQLGVVGVDAMTFHAAALKQLGSLWPHAIGGYMPDLMDSKSTLVAAAATRLGLRVDRVSIRDLAGEIEWSKVSMVSPDLYTQAIQKVGRALPLGFTAEEVVELLRTYEIVKAERDVIDFEDALLLLVGIFVERPDLARQIRERYRYFVVDEFQDVSPLQHALLGQWLGERHDICVVGDVAQTIYSFAGASPRYLNEFIREHRAAKIIELNRDYRSTPQIVSLANQIVDGLKGPHMNTTVKLVSQLPDGPQVQFRDYDSDEDEAAAIAAAIGALLKAGTQAKDIAILYRTNAQSAAFEKALGQAGISFRVQDAGRFFDRDDVRTLIHMLKTEAQAGSDASVGGVVRDFASTLGWEVDPPQTQGAARDRWEALGAIVEMAVRREAEGVSLAAFYLELEERASSQRPPDHLGVTLCSLHSAKGLEWDTVFLAGVSDGLLPITQAKTEYELEEERRLLYVGVTRARTRLMLSWARSRSGRSGGRRPSRFLEKIWPTSLDPDYRPAR